MTKGKFHQQFEEWVGLSRGFAQRGNVPAGFSGGGGGRGGAGAQVKKRAGHTLKRPYMRRPMQQFESLGCHGLGQRARARAMSRQSPVCKLQQTQVDPAHTAMNPTPQTLNPQPHSPVVEAPPVNAQLAHQLKVGVHRLERSLCEVWQGGGGEGGGGGAGGVPVCSCIVTTPYTALSCRPIEPTAML
jgi:hypothetical protein